MEETVMTSTPKSSNPKSWMNLTNTAIAKLKDSLISLNYPKAKGKGSNVFPIGVSNWSLNLINFSFRVESFLAGFPLGGVFVRLVISVIWLLMVNIMHEPYWILLADLARCVAKCSKT